MAPSQLFELQPKVQITGHINLTLFISLLENSKSLLTQSTRQVMSKLCHHRVGKSRKCSSWRNGSNNHYSLSSGRHYYSFTVENISDFSTLSYSVIYDTDSAPKGFIGSVNLNNQSEYKNENILLGSESSGGGIAFDQNVNNIKITVILTRPDGTTLTLEKTDD